MHWIAFKLFSLPPFEIFFLPLCSWPGLVFSFQLHQLCLLGVMHLSLFPPAPPRLPIFSLSHLLLSLFHSSVDHIWERLNISPSVCGGATREVEGEAGWWWGRSWGVFLNPHPGQSPRLWKEHSPLRGALSQTLPIHRRV